MPQNSTRLKDLKLSICITTLNRAAFIGETLHSIITQLTEECEVVVLDAASTDSTETIVSNLASQFSRLRYIRQQENNGVDRDYDRVVELARAEYCWLMTDDDLLKPDAVARVLDKLGLGTSMVVVNAEARDFTMSRVIQRKLLNFDSDRIYQPFEMNRLLREVGSIFRYIGAIVIKRSIWISRERKQFYGTLFAHFGTIFQEPLPQNTVVIADPLISYRMSNSHEFSSRAFEACMISWPSLVWSMPLPNSDKAHVISAEPWKHLLEALLWRGLDSYSMSEYRSILLPRLRPGHIAFSHALIARLPGVLANTLVVLYFAVTRRRYHGVWSAEYILHALKDSPFNLRNWRTLWGMHRPDAGQPHSVRQNKK